jgi:hypothetical protein
MKRRFPSSDPELEVKYRSRGNERDARVWGLVCEGCWLEAVYGSISPDENVILVFPGSTRAIGRIVRVQRHAAWVEFDPPMHSAVLAHVLGSKAGAARSTQLRVPGGHLLRPV